MALHIDKIAEPYHKKEIPKINQVRTERILNGLKSFSSSFEI